MLRSEKGPRRALGRSERPERPFHLPGATAGPPRGRPNAESIGRSPGGELLSGDSGGDYVRRTTLLEA